MNDYESFIYERDAYKHFLKNNKKLINQPGLNEKRSQDTINYIDVIINLFKLRNDFKMEDYLELKELITDKFRGNDWLLEKLIEIAEKNSVKPRDKKLKVKI